MAVKEELINEVINDLGANYNINDGEVIASIIDDVIEDALLMSNRSARATSGVAKDAQIIILASNIKKAVKTIYLQRGIEDVKSNSQSGLSNTYDDAMETMLRDLVRQNKRIMR